MPDFHLGWFLGSGVSAQGWGEPGFDNSVDWTKPDLFQDAAKRLEDACFDLLILEDTSAVPYTYQGSMDYYLRNGCVTPKLDPVLLVPYLAQVTKRLGLAVTMTSTFYPPWLLARSLATMDHYSSGRVAWNIVTATSDAAAQNYGYDKQFEHDLRYDMADEYVDLVTQLSEAWEEDAVVMDVEGGVLVDPSKVKALHFEGKFYKSRGPLNVPRSPQGRPIYVAPGGSPRGRRFSGRNADVVLATSGTLADMKKYREDVRGHAASFGRDPDSLKVMFALVPMVVDSAEEAVELKAKMAAHRKDHMEHSLAAMSFLSGIDFSKFDLDAPVGEIKTNGMQTMLQMFAKHGPQATLRTIMTEASDDGFNQIIGTPDMIASTMRDIVAEVGGDGFLIAGAFKKTYMSAICDRLVPELQRRNLTRSSYEHEHLRDNLMAF